MFLIHCVRHVHNALPNALLMIYARFEREPFNNSLRVRYIIFDVYNKRPTAKTPKHNGQGDALADAPRTF